MRVCTLRFSLHYWYSDAPIYIVIDGDIAYWKAGG